MFIPALNYVMPPHTHRTAALFHFSNPGMTFFTLLSLLLDNE
jgi:hypothetical protein